MLNKFFLPNPEPEYNLDFRLRCRAPLKDGQNFKLQKERFICERYRRFRRMGELPGGDMRTPFSRNFQPGCCNSGSFLTPTNFKGKQIFWHQACAIREDFPQGASFMSKLAGLKRLIPFPDN